MDLYHQKQNIWESIFEIKISLAGDYQEAITVCSVWVITCYMKYYLKHVIWNIQHLPGNTFPLPGASLLISTVTLPSPASRTTRSLMAFRALASALSPVTLLRAHKVARTGLSTHLTNGQIETQRNSDSPKATQPWKPVGDKPMQCSFHPDNPLNTDAWNLAVTQIPPSLSSPAKCCPRSHPLLILSLTTGVQPSLPFSQTLKAPYSLALSSSVHLRRGVCKQVEHHSALRKLGLCLVTCFQRGQYGGVGQGQ